MYGTSLTTPRRDSCLFSLPPSCVMIIRDTPTSLHKWVPMRTLTLPSPTADDPTCDIPSLTCLTVKDLHTQLGHLLSVALHAARQPYTRIHGDYGSRRGGGRGHAWAEWASVSPAGPGPFHVTKAAAEEFSRARRSRTS
ncbi:hypothetical protein H4582DRAFT_2063871 [Lactarius indigo]|nr:hypothetical protein H4582DRAFT_2063871 [Lactarius indigo]